MKESRILIPIIILTLLVACLAGTFAWFSSLEKINIGGELQIAVNHEVKLVLDNTIINSFSKYQGEKGYSNEGEIFDGADAPYSFNFDVTLKAQASTNVFLNFGNEYITIKIPNQEEITGSGVYLEGKSYSFYAQVFGEEVVEPSTPEQEAKFKAMFGAYEYLEDPTDYYYIKGTDKLVSNTTNKVKVYRPIDAAKNAKKDIMVVREGAQEGDPNPKYTTIVIKPEACNKYFDLTYARLGEENKVYKSFIEPQLLQKDLNEVGENITEAGPVQALKYNIKARFCMVNKTEPKYTTFKFSEEAFKGAIFSFVFKIGVSDV